MSYQNEQWEVGVSESNKNVVQDGQVVTLAYTLTVDGEVMDTSEGSQPIQFIQGQRHIIIGLENELYGMAVGDKKDVLISPENGYGEVDPENFVEVPKGQFPAHIPLEPGIELEVTDQNGQLMDARILSVEGDTVHLDFNHPLAGKVLHFSVAVIDLRDASDEEMEHGHVHSAGGEVEDEVEE
jgi:FKBP-type peptidyl-prolyl cis-trans isomerase SlyD